MQKKFKGEIDCDKLKNDKIKQEYIKNVENCLNPGNSEENLEDKWKLIKNSICNAANTVIGKVTRSQTMYWFDEECAIANEKKNAAYKYMIQAYTSLGVS
ncbi:craniofacial development protein 2 [Trichonephila clavata]|uniref:Craniofacial development protein 2 n=1 Tax=Trichonephila clavata TaxID=2740835 RepID=A0A8X6HQD6_TRICU|nr:craniofacial development protein 2 [Trichonephila clavata]